MSTKHFDPGDSVDWETPECWQPKPPRVPFTTRIGNWIRGMQPKPELHVIVNGTVHIDGGTVTTLTVCGPAHIGNAGDVLKTEVWGGAPKPGDTIELGRGEANP